MVRDEFGTVLGFVEHTEPTNVLVWLRATPVSRERHRLCSVSVDN